MANPEHVELAKSGKEAIAEWRRTHRGVRLDLSGHNLRGADLGGANLRGANLRGAYLHWANLSGANLAEANLSKAKCGHTTFANCDLSQCQGLETISHERPSSVGIDTILLSRGKIRRAFLKGAGLPEPIIDALLSQLTGGQRYYKVFISYGAPDKKFAKHLYKDLTDKGVQCWLYPESAIMGRKVWENIHRAIQENEKMVVICSGDSLCRPGVLEEIERALHKEEELKRENLKRKQEAAVKKTSPELLDEDVLFPVRLDDYVLKEWQNHLKPQVVNRNVGDFGHWQTNPVEYQKELGKLLHGLDPTSWPLV